MNWKTAAIVFVTSFATVSTANAGLFDFLFGKRPAAQAPAPVAHPVVTVSKPRAKRIAKAERRKQPAQPKMIFTDRKAVLAGSIDPVANPDWYLFDPTLRRGDILVLANGVLVFTGGRIGAPKSYVALEQTRLLNRKERLIVAEMTRRPSEPMLLADGAGPRQPRMMRSAGLIRPLELRSGL